MEEWKDVLGYEGIYVINNYGVVMNATKGNILSTKKNNRGYVQIHLYKNAICKMMLVHRLVAIAFIDNKNNYPQINHIDENKENNHVSNLEWCTNKYNRHHGTGIERMAKNHDYKAIGLKNSKPVYQIDKDGNIVNRFCAIIEAQRQTGINEANIRRSMQKNHHAGGYKWKYVNA